MKKFIPKLLAVSALAVVTSQAHAATATITGTGTLTGQTSSLVNSSYVYSSIGGTGDQFDGVGTFAGTILQDITNAIGSATVTTDVFWDNTGFGSQEVLGCTGVGLICDDINAVVGTPDAINPYFTGPTTPNATGFSYDQVFVVDTPLGLADSASSLNIAYESAPEVPLPAAAWLFGSALLGLAGVKRRKQS